MKGDIFMEALECLKTRRSVRKYSDKPVEKEKLDAILEAATYAPTGGGSQSPVIVLVSDPDQVAELGRMNAQVGGMGGMNAFYGAPCVAIVFANTKAMTWMEDAVLVAGNLLNAAHAVGVDSCYIYRAEPMFKTDEGKSLMTDWGLSEDYVGVANCILGYGAVEAPEPAPRKADYIRVV